jgi:hypothetical protein
MEIAANIFLCHETKFYEGTYRTQMFLKDLQQFSLFNENVSKLGIAE